MTSLSAQMFETWDRCPRRLALEREHEPRTISPLGLMYAGVEGGIVAPDPCEGARDAIRAVAAVKDVDAGPLAAISCVRHVGLMAEVISLALRRKLGPMKRVAAVPLAKHEWQSGLFETKGAILHRIILVSHIDDDVLRGFAHSWGTVGELAALERDVTLTFVAIGAQRSGRRHSHWSRCYQHPIQKTALRFAPRKNSNGFTAGWGQIWRDQTDIAASRWLDQMTSDGVVEDLIQSRQIRFNAEDCRLKQAREDLFKILPKMGTASVDAPMNRTSCDDPIRGSCIWQSYCWSPVEVSLEDLGHLYKSKEAPVSESLYSPHLTPPRRA